MGIQIRSGKVLEMLDNLLYSIPDISAISTPEVELPTLSLDSGQLSTVSLMDHVATIHLDPLSSDIYSVDTRPCDPLLELTNLQPSEETNSEPSQFWYLNNSTGGLADNTGQGFQVNPLNNFGRVNSVDGGRGQKSLPETVSKIKVEKQSQGKTNSKLSYNMEMFEEPLICYEDNYSAAETIDNLLT